LEVAINTNGLITGDPDGGLLDVLTLFTGGPLESNKEKIRYFGKSTTFINFSMPEIN
jgi:hypothetical protein